MLIRLKILSLLQMPFLLNLTDSLTFNCFLLIIQLFQKRLSERLANGECRTEVARPKGTVVTLFDMQNFISCVHLA